MSRLARAVVLGFVFALFAAPAFAQPSDRRGDRVLESAASERDAREMVEVMMMVRISRELELTEEETVLLVRRAGEARDEMNRLNRERRVLISELRAATSQNLDDEEILARLEKLKVHDERLAEAKRGMHEKLAEGLDATQQVRLYVFLQEFDANMRNMIQRVRERSRMFEGGRMGRSGGQPRVPRSIDSVQPRGESRQENAASKPSDEESDRDQG